MNFDNKAIVVNTKVVQIEAIGGSTFCYSNKISSPPIPFVENLSGSYVNELEVSKSEELSYCSMIRTPISFVENVSGAYVNDRSDVYLPESNKKTDGESYVIGSSRFHALVLSNKRKSVNYPSSCAHILPLYKYNKVKYPSFDTKIFPLYKHNNEYKYDSTKIYGNNAPIFNYNYSSNTWEQKFCTKIIRKTIDIKSKAFPYVSVLIKYEKPIVYEGSSDRDTIEITVQKNEYFEIITDSLISKIEGLPDEIKYSSNKIYGTPSKSGQSIITINYSEGKQKLIINVPYYRRIL